MGAMRRFGAQCLCDFVAATLGLSLLGGNFASGGFNIFLNPADPATLDANWNAGGWGDDWMPYILGVASDDGSRIGAVDVDLRGVFHQRWNWSEESLDFAASARGLGVSGGDSHLLMPDNALLPVTPYEDNNLSSANLSLPDVPGKYDYGIGSQLKGVWGIPGAPATSQNLAYLVMPRGYESQLEYAIDVADSRGQLSRFRQGASFPALPPEPQVVIPDTLPKRFNPLPSVVMPVPAGPEPTAPESPAAPTPPLAAGPDLFPWIMELDHLNDPALPRGYKAYKYGVSTRDGSSIAAVDFRLGSGALQVVQDLDGDGVPDPTIRGLATTGADSHLLIPDGSVVMPLSEVLSDFSVGGDPSLFKSRSMGGAWGFPTEMQSDTADLAYLVVSEYTDIQRMGLYAEVATRSGDTFLPTTFLMAKHFALLDTSGNVIRPARIDLPPIVEEPVVPVDPPVVIDEPWSEYPLGFPVVTIDDPVEQTTEIPSEVAAIDGPTPPPIRTVTSDPLLSVPVIDWTYITGWKETDIYAHVDTTRMIDLVDVGIDADAPLSLREAIVRRLSDQASDPANFGPNAWLAYAAYDSAAVNAPEPTSLVLAAMVGMVAVAARHRAG